MDIVAMAIDRTLLLADLTRDEGFRPFIYDDANGNEVVPGYTLIGKATLAVGWCPQTNPCPPDLGQYILGYFVDDETKRLYQTAPWIAQLSEPLQRSLCDMAFNLGVAGLLKFTQFLGFMQAGAFSAAADDLQTTPWYKQVGNRGVRIVATIRSGA